MLLHALPIFHTHGLFVATNATLLSSASMIFLPKFNLDAVFAALAGCDSDDGSADFLYPSAVRSAAEQGQPRATSGCSFPVRRRSWPKPTANGRRAPDTPFWNATA